MSGRDWGLFSAFCLAVLAGILLIGLSPRSGGPVAVMVAPWQPASRVMEIVAAADGRYVRSGVADWIIVASSSHSDFVGRLYSAGAWLVADPAAAGGCFIEERAF